MNSLKKITQNHQQENGNCGIETKYQIIHNKDSNIGEKINVAGKRSPLQPLQRLSVWHNVLCIR